MMLGHGLLAFAIVASAAAARGYSRRQALAVGVVAGAFGALPDVDMLYAVWGALGTDAGGILAVNEAFWAASRVTHRSATHSLIVAVPIVAAVALLARRRRIPGATPLAGGLLAAVVLAGARASGSLDALMLAVFVAGAAGLAVATRRWTDLDWRSTTAAAAVGLLSHPWGDLFTGGPPHLLYPLSPRVFEARVVVAADPTIHLLFTFALEVIAVWTAAAVYLRLTDRSLGEFVDWRPATLGVGYAAAVLFVPAPTLDVPSLFVFSILGVGILLAVSTPLIGWRSRARTRASRRFDGERHPDGRRVSRVAADGGTWRGVLPAGVDSATVLRPLLTGTAGVSMAWIAYLGAYLVVAL